MKKQFVQMSCMLGFLVLPLHAEDKPESALAKQMEVLNDAFKSFRRETDAVKGAASAREAQDAVLKGMVEVPELVKAMPDGPDKVKAIAAYRKLTGKLFVTLCEVEEAFLAGKIDEVAKIVESIKEMKKEGHDKFMEEDK